MASCCSTENHNPVKNPCPVCGTAGKAVAISSLYHQIRFPDNLTVPAADYYLCAKPDCALGYYSDTGLCFKKSQLREAEHIAAGWLCYCFDISKADYRAALDNRNADEIKKFVIEQTRIGSCACSSRNPSGQCCLADFKRVEKVYANEPQ